MKADPNWPYLVGWERLALKAKDERHLESLIADFARLVEAEVGSILMIKQESKHKFVLYSKKTGKALGVHPSKEKALKQEQAIEISKHAGEKGATKPKRSK